jgi:hypothetical protein
MAAFASTNKPFAITHVYDILLRGDPEGIPIGLYHLHIATAEQLCRLHYSPKTLKTIKARLCLLLEKGYVQFVERPTRRGRSPYYYALSQKGMDFVAQLGYEPYPLLSFNHDDDEGSPFLIHTLDINDILIAAVLLKQIEPMCSLERFIHERTLKLTTYTVPWHGKWFTLLPDGLLDFHTVTIEGKLLQTVVLLEHDQGVEEQQSFRRKIRAYIALLHSQAYQNLFGVKGSPTIAFTTFTGEKRREQLREWTYQELASTNEPPAIGMAFCFTSQLKPLDPHHLWLEPCWYTPYEEDQPFALLVRT